MVQTAGARYPEQPFLGRIVNVGWASGAVVIVQVTAAEIKFYDVTVLNPPDVFEGFFNGASIAESDYQDDFVLQITPPGNEGSVVVEDEIHPWLWDGFLIGDIGDDFTAGIASGTAFWGYPPNLHLVGAQVAHDTQHFPGGPPRLGDYVTHTHPNGSGVLYASGYTALSSAYLSWHGPNGDFTGYVIRPSDPNGFPEPPADLSNTEAYYWYRVTTRAAREAALLKKSFLVNIRKDFVQLAELQDFTVMLDHPLEWSIRGYPQGTAFSILDGVMTPVGGVKPKFEASGSVAGGHSGTIRRFNANGFVES